MSSFDVCDLVLDPGKKQFNLKSLQSSSSRPKGATKPTKKGTLKPWVLKGWQKEFSWLCYDAGTDVVSCKFCSIEWPAANVRKIQLSTHAKTFKHLKDAKGVKGATDSQNAAALRLAPSVHEFRETISQRLKGCSFRDANQGSKREQKMTWCVGEALRERQRKMLRKAHCVCVAQDAQGSRLSVRVSCCFGDLLEVASFLCGYKNAGTGSEAVAKATKRLVVQLFTKFRRPPLGWNSKSDIVLDDSIKQFCSKVDS